MREKHVQFFEAGEDAAEAFEPAKTIVRSRCAICESLKVTIRRIPITGVDFHRDGWRSSFDRRRCKRHASVGTAEAGGMYSVAGGYHLLVKGAIVVPGL